MLKFKMNCPERCDSVGAKEVGVTERILSITLPEDVFQTLQYVANNSHRTIDEVIAKTVNATFRSPAELPPPLAAELAGMLQAKDELLWAALNPSVTVKQQLRLQELNEVARQRTLTQAEVAEQEHLLMVHHYAVLRRAQAIAILTLRGYHVSDERLQQTVR